MKNYTLKIYIVLLLFCSNIAIYATPGQDQVDGGCLECGETPINGSIIWLVIAGVAFMLYYFSKKKFKTV